METIFVGADHAGFAAKNVLVKMLQTSGYEVVDCGAEKLQPEDDYPLYAERVAHAVAAGRGRGLLLCDSGQGMAMVANRVPGVRAVVVWNKEVAVSSREDNDANVLAVPAHYLSLIEMKKIVQTWLKTPFSGLLRHERRVAQIDHEIEVG